MMGKMQDDTVFELPTKVKWLPREASSEGANARHLPAGEVEQLVDKGRLADLRPSPPRPASKVKL